MESICKVFSFDIKISPYLPTKCFVSIVQDTILHPCDTCWFHTFSRVLIKKFLFDMDEVFGNINSFSV